MAAASEYIIIRILNTNHKKELLRSLWIGFSV